MVLRYNSSGYVTFTNGTANLGRTYETDYEKEERLKWEKFEKLNKEKKDLEEREEIRGIYKFHKLPVPDFIVPEIVPEVNFGSKAYYSWMDRKGGRTYAFRNSCTTLGIRNHGYKFHWVNYYAQCDKNNRCDLYPKNRCDSCKAGNTLKGRLWADYLKDGIFQSRFCWTIHIKKKKVVISEPEVMELEKLKCPQNTREHRFHVRPLIKGVNS